MGNENLFAVTLIASDRPGIVAGGVSKVFFMRIISISRTPAPHCFRGGFSLRFLSSTAKRGGVRLMK